MENEEFEQDTNMSRDDEPRVIFRLSPGVLEGMINVEIDFGSCGVDGWDGTMVGGMAQRLVDTLKANMTADNPNDNEQPQHSGH